MELGHMSQYNRRKHMNKWKISTIILLIVSIWHSVVAWGGSGGGSYFVFIVLGLLPPYAKGRILGWRQDWLIGIILVWVTLVITFICWLQGRKYFTKKFSFIILFSMIILFIVSLINLKICLGVLCINRIFLD
jgi:hypothetical protein